MPDKYLLPAEVLNAVLDRTDPAKNKLRVDATIQVEHIDIGNVGLLDSADARINPAKEDGNLADVKASIGAKADARSTATDTTAISLIQVLKQISYMAQNPAAVAVSGVLSSPKAYLVIDTLAMAAKESSYIITLPNPCFGFTIRAQGSVATLSLQSIAPSPAGAALTNYITLEPNAAYNEESCSWVNGKIYVQSKTANTTVQIMAWTELPH